MGVTNTDLSSCNNSKSTVQGKQDQRLQTMRALFISSDVRIAAGVQTGCRSRVIADRAVLTLLQTIVLGCGGCRDMGNCKVDSCCMCRASARKM